MHVCLHALQASSQEVTAALINAFETADTELLRHLERLGGEALEQAGSTGW